MQLITCQKICTIDIKLITDLRKRSTEIIDTIAINSAKVEKLKTMRKINKFKIQIDETNIMLFVTEPKNIREHSNDTIHH